MTVRVGGELDVAVERQFVDTVNAELIAGRGSVTLDLTRVTFLDSGGLRGLIQCLTAAQRIAVPLLLTVRSGPVTRLLDTSGVRDLFTYSSSRDEDGRQRHR